jgi:signal transduction histidine kinase
MEFYRLRRGTPVLISSVGSRVPQSERTIQERIHAARLDIATGESAEILIHIHSPRKFFPDFAVSVYSQFMRYIKLTNLLFGICFGIEMLVILITSIFAYQFRDRAYASVAALSVVIILSTLLGFGFRDLQNNPALGFFGSADWMKIVRPMIMLFFLNLTSVFLTLRINAPKLNQWLQALMLSGATLSALAFVPGVSRYAMDAADRIIFLSMILTLAAGYRSWRNGVPLAGYFLFATLTLNLTSLPLMICLLNNGMVSFLALNIVPVGQSVLMIILCMALIAKVRYLDEARIGAEIEAGKSEDLKTMLRVMSHDLNNPLTVVLAYAQKGKKKMEQTGNHEMASYFEKILKASRNQLEIIEHIKIMRAMDDGKTQMDLKSVQLVDVMRQVEATFEQRLIEKNVRLVYNPDEMTGISVIAEDTSLNHNVLNNLISNAIKFSRAGTTIDITTRGDGENVLLMVQDHGIGMPKDLIANVFRTDNPTSRVGTEGEKGTGFGMPVVKSYMERFGGSIKIDSVTETESPAAHGTQVTLSFKKAS